MPYEEITSHRIAYDIDGTAVSQRLHTNWVADIRNGVGFLNGVGPWLSSADATLLNSYKREKGFAISHSQASNTLWFFFPELVELEGMTIVTNINNNPDAFILQGSTDSTNGLDGTWVAATMTPDLSKNDAHFWRHGIFATGFPGPVKAIRMSMHLSAGENNTLYHIHLYGRKAAGETPDDVIFCEVDGTPITAVMDFGDRPEGTTVIDSFKIKNTSTAKIAQDVNLQLNHTDYGLSFNNDGPWTPTLDISSIAPDSLSTTVYVRNMLQPPPLTLGPVEARCIARIGSWS